MNSHDITVITMVVIYIIIAISNYIEEQKKHNSTISYNSSTKQHNWLKEDQASEELLTYQFKYTKSKYLASPLWNKKRKQVLKRDNYTCQICGITNTILVVHHMYDYLLIPNEPLSCLITLCKNCHEQEHKKHGIPSSYSEYKNFNHNIV